MKKMISSFFVSLLLASSVIADDALDDIKKAMDNDNRPGQHGRDNAAEAQKNNPGKGNKHDDGSLWDKIEGEIDEDDKKNKGNKNKGNKNKK